MLAQRSGGRTTATAIVTTDLGGVMERSLRRYVAITTPAIMILALGLIAGCADSSTSPSGETITVSGVVVDEFGLVQRNAHVLIIGHAPVYADADGRFTVRGVRRPYDLATGLLFERAALVYKGLTRPDPTVVVPPSRNSPSPSYAVLTGTVTGGAASMQPANHRTSVLFESPAMHVGGTVQDDYGYLLALSWRGATSSTGALHALQWQFDPVSGRPVDYLAYGNATGVSVTYPMSGSGPAVPIAAPVTEGSLSGEVVPPAGVSVVAKTLRLGFTQSTLLGPAMRLVVDSGNANAFSYVTPDLPGATFSLTVDVSQGQATGSVVRNGFSAHATGLSVAVPPLPALISPAEGDLTVGSATKFSWTRTEGALYLLSLYYIGPQNYQPPAPNFYVFTMDSSVTIPNVGPLGTVAYQGSLYRWDVHTWAPVSSADAIAVPSWFAPRGDRVQTVSGSRTFTTLRSR